MSDKDWESYRGAGKTGAEVAVRYSKHFGGDRPEDAQLGQRQGQGMEKLRLVSVKQAERETRLKFFSNLPSQVQQVIESKVDSQ